MAIWTHTGERCAPEELLGAAQAEVLPRILAETATKNELLALEQRDYIKLAEVKADLPGASRGHDVLRDGDDAD